MRYRSRTLESSLRQAAREFPAVLLTGPRQSGKTTLLRHLFGRSARYVALDLPDMRLAASTDPRGFLAEFQPPVIFDEVQAAPALLPYIRAWIDENRGKRGQFLLSGSQNLMLMERVGETLAGRSAQLHLHAFSNREREGAPGRRLIWQIKSGRRVAPHPPRELWCDFLRGGFPKLVVEPDRDPHLWHASYLETYLERDVRTLRQVGDLTQFQAFVRALAARSAQLLNMADLGRALGLSLNTVKAWVSVLEASFQITIVRPFFANVGKRLAKTPKVFFNDVGMLCHLTGLRDPGQAMAGPMGGAIFETAVFTEIQRSLAHMGGRATIYLWRTGAGQEVDFLVEDGDRLIPIEVKLSSTPSPRMARGIHALQADLGERLRAGYVVHPGEVSIPLGKGVRAIPFATL